MIKRTVPWAVFNSRDALRFAKIAHKQACEELDKTPRRMLDEGNPNHPMYDQIFGYDREEFVAKQYK